jgi:ion channel-forming bestrophin family protein
MLPAGQHDRNTFLREAFTLADSVTPRVLPYVGAFALFSAVVAAVSWCCERYYGFHLVLEVGFHEIGGVVLTIALILRTNAGYERWWEARKLWGGIVNQCRNLAISGLAYGPKDSKWQEQLVRWTAIFPFAARSTLEGVPLAQQAEELLGMPEAKQLRAAQHMPSYVAKRIAEILEAGASAGMSRFAFVQIDKERATLIDHIGGCERILKTPLPQVYSIKIRRILALFLLTLPFVLLDRVSHVWLVPLITTLVAYPLISLDQIGHELQNPFCPRNLSHLPLTDISMTIERNLQGLIRPPLEVPANDGFERRNLAIEAGS